MPRAEDGAMARCLLVYFFHGAIASPVIWPLFAPFMKCNVRAALKDPKIDHVRVVHDYGKTGRV
jgi:hypothetical protein